MIDSRRQTTAKTWIAVLAITLIAFVLRVYRLDFVSLRGDEAFTVIFVQRTWEGLWKGISTIEPNPPLMYLALRAWIAVAGASEFATRYFSAFFGVLCVPLLYRLAREMFARRVIASTCATLSVNSAKQSPQHIGDCFVANDTPRNDRIALLAAALIAINPYQIWHSQDVRNYTMWPALSLVALIFFWRWWNAEQKAEGTLRGQKAETAKSDVSFVISNLSFYSLATLASLYTHYFDTFILAAINLFVFSFATWERKWKTLARWIGAQVVLVLAYAPWVLFGTNRIETYGEASAQQGVPLLDQFSRTLANFVLGETVPAILKTLTWLPLALVLIASLIYLTRRDKMRAAFLFLCIAVPTLALFIISIWRPLFLERYLNGIAPVYYLIFAIGLGALLKIKFQISNPKLWLLPFAICFLFFVLTSAYALTNYFFNPEYVKSPNWRAPMQYIKDHREPGDFVIQNFTEMSPLYYLGRDLPLTTLPQGYWAKPSDEKMLNQLNKDYRRIWFIPAQPDWWDNAQFVEKFLSRRDERILEQPLDKFRLQLYLTPREFESKIVPVNARVGNATLIGYRAEGARKLHLVLYWRADKQIEKDFTVFAHIADADNHVIAQHDGAPAFALYPTTAWQAGESIVDVHDILVDASGTYTLIVGMYEPNTLARVPTFDSNGARLLNDQVVLTQITIPQ